MPSSSFNALIFIPDISGFTHFVNKTSIEHSTSIIKELLEVIMEQNEIGLKLVEIEGDALLYYKEQSSQDSPEKLVEQCRSMFLAFHRHLKLYERDRICNCEACTGAHNLGLKFIIHSGEVALQKILDREKIMGREVILAHRLMKNSVDSDNYILFSESISESDDNNNLTSFNSGKSEYPEIGTVEFQYSDISPWIQETPSLPKQKPIKYVSNPLRLDIEIEKNIDFVHSFLVSLKHRPEWSPELIDFIYEKDKIDRVGSTHDCVLPDNIIHVTTVASDHGKEHITYAEKSDKLGIIPESFQIFKLEKTGESSCKLTVENHIRLFFPLNLLLRSKFKKIMKQALKNFKNHCETKWTREDMVIQA